jgi:hypothetical protein
MQRSAYRLVGVLSALWKASQKAAQWPSRRRSSRWLHARIRHVGFRDKFTRLRDCRSSTEVNKWFRSAQNRQFDGEMGIEPIHVNLGCSCAQPDRATWHRIMARLTPTGRGTRSSPRIFALCDVHFALNHPEIDLGMQRSRRTGMERLGGGGRIRDSYTNVPLVEFGRE